MRKSNRAGRRLKIDKLLIIIARDAFTSPVHAAQYIHTHTRAHIWGKFRAEANHVLIGELKRTSRHNGVGRLRSPAVYQF